MTRDPVHRKQRGAADRNGLPIGSERLQRQIDFLLEIDKLKFIVRRTPLTDRSRLENAAEHSWHISLAVLVLAEYAAEPGTDTLHAVKLLLIHDLIEIDAGDTYCYDENGRQDQKQREKEAAERIFSLLPGDQKDVIRALWEEFETRQTAEAKFAHAMDRLMPLLHNFVTNGQSWRENGIRRSQVEKRMAPIAAGSPRLHAFAQSVIDAAERKGYLGPD
jgi:putative hydrolase of HD superfamily